MIKCYWWNRWYHKRLRDIDMKTILTAIHNSAGGDLQKVTKAWNLHKLLPGQEHWHCECSKQTIKSIQKLAK